MDQCWVRNSSLVKDGVLVHAVRVGERNYAYDAYSGRVFECHPVGWDILNALALRSKVARENSLTQLIALHGEAAVESCLSDFGKRKEAGGLFGPGPERFHIKPLKGPSPGRPCLTLEMTEGCNLRCSYCVFAGGYESERGHSSQHLAEQAALKAIDDFFATLPEGPAPNLAFYGGEPLLRFEVIKSCMAHARAGRPDCGFNVATNGVLLDLPTFRWLRDYETEIFVSLDGPKEIQDRQRRTVADEGSFDKLSSALRAAAAEDPGFFRSHVRLQLTLRDAKDIPILSEFFRKDPFFHGIPILIHLEREAGRKADDLAWERFTELPEVVEALARYKAAILAGDLGPATFEHSLFAGDLLRLLIGPGAPIEKDFRIKGPCEPGTKRLFLTARGGYTICEKTGRLPVVGTLEGGMDRAALDKMEDSYLGTCGPCRNCWALRLCSLCYVHCYNDRQEIDRAMKAGFCARTRDRFDAILRLYLEVLDADPGAFARLEPSFFTPEFL